MPSVPPLGLSPLSAFSTPEFAEQATPPAIKADKIHPTTLEFLSLEETYTIAEGMAIVAVRTKRGSGASVRDVGNRFDQVRQVTPEAPGQLESFVREAFQPARVLNVSRVRTVTVEVDEEDGSQINGEVTFTDERRRRDEIKLQFPLGATQ